ncbi:MAG: hypothetical protein ACI837_000056 [Crocinitomicaceae bacterium]|jgi:hypothetical protein
MKYSLFAMMLMMVLVSSASTSIHIIERDTITPPDGRIEITGQEVDAWYSHGGDLAKVNAVRFHVKNSTNSDVLINVRELALVHTDREGKEQSKALVLAGMELSNEGIIDDFVFRIPANSSLDLDVMIESIDIGIFYYKSYRAIRLYADIDGISITSDAELDVMREDDYDYKESLED